MLTLRSQLRLGVTLGVLSLVALAISHLALTDIAHGETNPWQEWLALQVSGIVLLLFVAVSLATFVRLVRVHSPGEPSALSGRTFGASDRHA